MTLNERYHLIEKFYKTIDKLRNNYSNQIYPKKK